MKRQLQDQDLAALGRKLPFEAPTSQRVEHVRNELLSAAANLPPQRSAGRRRGWGLAITAIAAGLAGVALVWSTGSEPSRAPIAKRRVPSQAPVAPVAPVAPKTARHAPEVPQDQRTNLATVHGTGEATFERKTLSLPSSPTDEVVYLNDGVIRLDVRPLQKGERFRVITPDAEIEVRGTSFRVAVSSGRLLEVEVLSGRVEVRPKGQSKRTLSAQERWRSPTKPSARVVKKPRAEARATAPATDVRPMKRKEPKPELKVTPKPQAEDPMERAFREGWRMMRAKKYGRASEVFRAALRAHPDAPLSQDASYWLTVALLKSGDRASAARALERFLDRYPTAARAGEARVMLAGLLGRSAPARARALCAAALKDQSPKVRAKAQALIERLDQAGRNAP